MKGGAGGAPPLSAGLNLRLSLMMFLQYAIWGAWLPLFYPFLTGHRMLTPAQAGQLFALAASGALLAPFVAGQIADRWFNTERFLAISHLAGAALVWRLATVESFGGLCLLAFLYSLLYAPTIPLTNSLAFHHLPDRDRDFGRVRLWGTLGWIAVGIGFAQWLRAVYSPGRLHEGMADMFRLSAALGVVLAAYSLTLPATPPQRGRMKFAPFEAMRDFFRAPRTNPLFWLFVITFPVACVHQFYFVHTAGFLQSIEAESAAIDRVFGMGGGGLMTIGQMAEIVVLACMPLLARRIARKGLLTIGLLAYVVRFAVFASAPHACAVIPALALHGLCFGCYVFVAFMIVDEETTPDVRASAQGLFNLVVIGFGIIVGNLFAGEVASAAAKEGGGTDYGMLFAVPMAVAAGCLVALRLFYPRARAA